MATARGWPERQPAGSRCQPSLRRRALSLTAMRPSARRSAELQYAAIHLRQGRPDRIERLAQTAGLANNPLLGGLRCHGDPAWIAGGPVNYIRSESIVPNSKHHAVEVNGTVAIAI